MTIRARILVTQTVLAAVVLALCILVVQLSGMARTLARMPTAHLDALAEVHDLFDAAGQAVKDLADFAEGEEDSAELEEQVERVSTTLDRIRERASDPIIAAIVGELAAKYHELQSGCHRVVALVAMNDLPAAKKLAFPLGEVLYEGEFRPLLERLEARTHAITIAVRVDGEERAGAASTRAFVLVGIGVLSLVWGTMIVVRIRRRLSQLATAVTKMGADIHTARSNDDASDELGDLGRSFNRMANDVATLIDTTTAKEALASELALAARLQQSLLPPTPRVDGLDIAGAMSAVAQVGGDYYDVIPTKDGAWIAIGDVSGHGFNTGVITMLAQSAIASVTRTSPDARPADVLRTVNEVLHDLVHTRLHLHDHMALTLLRYRHDGTIEFSGAHQEILVRAADGAIRTIETTGPWLAMMTDIGPHLVDAKFRLGDNETMVLFTDGVVDARVGTDDMFGLPRLIDGLAALPPNAGAAETRDSVFRSVFSLAEVLEDDATVLVIRRSAISASRAA